MLMSKSNPVKSYPSDSLKPYMQHFGKSPEEQLQLNQPAMKLLKKWMQEEVTDEEAKRRRDALERLKQIIDSFRPSGHKIYSQE